MDIVWMWPRQVGYILKGLDVFGYDVFRKGKTKVWGGCGQVWEWFGQGYNKFRKVCDRFVYIWKVQDMLDMSRFILNGTGV